MSRVRLRDGDGRACDHGGVTDVADRLEESLWDAVKHPRGRAGEWTEVFHEAPEIKQKLHEREVRQNPPLAKIERRDRSLLQTEAFRRGRRRLSYMSEYGVHGDEFLYDLAVDQGFAGRPQVRSEASLKQIIDSGGLEMYRGVTDEDYARLLLGGTLYMGQGFRGNGIYGAMGPDAHKQAVAYAQAPPNRGIAAKSDNPVVIHMALHPDAKTIPYKDAKSRADAEFLKWATQTDGDATVMHDPGTTGTTADVRREANRDASRWALANGYDAIIVDDKGEVIVLNRTALVMSDTFEPAGTNMVNAPRQAGR